MKRNWLQAFALYLFVVASSVLGTSIYTNFDAVEIQVPVASANTDLGLVVRSGASPTPLFSIAKNGVTFFDSTLVPTATTEQVHSFKYLGNNVMSVGAGDSFLSASYGVNLFGGEAAGGLSVEIPGAGEVAVGPEGTVVELYAGLELRPQAATYQPELHDAYCITGIPKYAGAQKALLVDLGTLVDGTSSSIILDDSPTEEWSAVDGDVTVTANTGYYRMGANSLKGAFASTAAAGDGVTRALSTVNYEALESVGFWAMSSVDVASGDLVFRLVDDGGNRDYDLPALVANTWTWVELDISALAGGTGDVITSGKVILSAAGATALAAFNLYLDQGAAWDAADEVAIGQDIAVGGASSGILMLPTLAASNNNFVIGAEGTDYITHYETGNDFLVMLTNQSANEGTAYIQLAP